MKKYTQEDLKTFERDGDGYLLCPSGDYTAIDRFDKKCSFDDGCIFGNDCSFGERCSFGRWCSFGKWCSFGERCSFGEQCSFGEWCSFGERCRFGKWCKCENGQEFTALFTVGYIGSRDDQTYFFKLADGNILVRCGCFCGGIAEFREKVKNTHGDSKHGKVYMAAADLAELQLSEEEC